VEQITDNIETLALVSNTSQAEDVAQYLRDADVATHQYWVEDYYSFARELAKHSWDLVILAFHDRKAHVPACILRYPDTPFIAIVPGKSKKLHEELLEYGVTDVASFAQPKRLRHSIERALREAATRRQHLIISQQYNEQEHLFKNLLNSSDEPVAFVHQGAHSCVNPAYLRLFGLADEATAVATPLLDLIAKRDQRTLNKLLRDLHSERIVSAELGARLRKVDGDTALATLSLSRARFRGESVIQVRAKSGELTRSGNGKTPLSASTGANYTGKNAPAAVSLLQSLSVWTGLAGDLVGNSTLHIAIRALSGLAPDNEARFSLAATLAPTTGGLQSLEKALSEMRRLDLLEGLDKWLLYNAASALAKQITTGKSIRFYVSLYGDTRQLTTLTSWLGKLLDHFSLPRHSLNLVIDSASATDNKNILLNAIPAIQSLGVGIGLNGLQLDDAIITDRCSDTEADNTIISQTQFTENLNQIDPMALDFALLEESISGAARKFWAQAAIPALIESSRAPHAALVSHLKSDAQQRHQSPTQTLKAQSRFDRTPTRHTGPPSPDSNGAGYSDLGAGSLDLTLAIERPALKPVVVS